MDSGQAMIEILIFAMVLMALGIATVKTVKEMIQLYQLQSLILALVTLFTVTDLRVRLVALLPVGLALSIKALLARATLPDPAQANHQEKRSWRERWIYWFQGLPDQVAPIWQRRRTSRSQPVVRLAFNLGLTAAAYIIAFSLEGLEGSDGNLLIDRWSLAASMALVLLGLFTMGNKQDIISQIMGLLVMEHGMFLAAIQYWSRAIIFIVSLFLYLIITLTILVYLLPELHHASGSIEVEEQKQLKG